MLPPASSSASPRAGLISEARARQMPELLVPAAVPVQGHIPGQGQTQQPPVGVMLWGGESPMQVVVVVGGLAARLAPGGWGDAGERAGRAGRSPAQPAAHPAPRER